MSVDVEMAEWVLKKRGLTDEDESDEDDDADLHKKQVQKKMA